MAEATEPPQRRELLLISYDKTFTSMDELRAEATFILLGQVTHQWVTFSGSPGKDPSVPSTHSTLLIERTFKGALGAGEQVEVVQLGGQAQNGTLFMAEEYPLLLPGRHYIVFLNESRSLIPPQRVYSLDEDNRVNALTPEPVCARLGLPRARSQYQVPLERFLAQLSKPLRKRGHRGKLLGAEAPKRIPGMSPTLRQHRCCAKGLGNAKGDSFSRCLFA